ncbi:MAG: hypothetical protein K8S13_23990 [Desulfobacula sp.]|uniref:hypothetical protein n=1 Tax=Desulfobacula sp. TaxID=2593537 RepID=UPI0025BB1029|nr:hypothetical protein [Desulfobacula sp.]MCD4722890.1 hypothetical protein [Desulfobacula sp.]
MKLKKHTEHYPGTKIWLSIAIATGVFIILFISPAWSIDLKHMKKDKTSIEIVELMEFHPQGAVSKITSH